MSTPPEFNVERLSASGSLTDRVGEALARVVEGGEYPPGARLPTEHEMADRFGVSRTVIREAVARLKSAGLVESRQGSGVFVRAPGAHLPFRIAPPGTDAPTRSLLELMELRRALEAEAAALAAERCTRAQLSDIRAAMREVSRADVAGGDGAAADVRFHRAIARATGNRHYPALWDFIGQFLRDAMRAARADDARRAGSAAEVREEHRALVEAIARRDPAGARAVALRHMERAAQRMLAAHGLGDGAAPAPPRSAARTRRLAGRAGDAGGRRRREERAWPRSP